MLKLPSSKRLTDSQIKRLCASGEITLFNCVGKYTQSENVDEIERMMLLCQNRSFFSLATRDIFVVDAVTAGHFFGKVRGIDDYKRRAKLFSSGLEIAEHSSLLSVIDVTSDADKNISYYEILGLDTRNFPGKIIIVKLSEILNEGKRLWTIVDISTLKNNIPPPG